MNHCHKKMTFIKRVRNYRVFKCNVCEMGTVAFDNRRRIDGYLNELNEKLALSKGEDNEQI